MLNRQIFDMEYQLIRSKRKQLTVCIIEGKVVVKAPKEMSLEHIEDFLEKKRTWIESKCADYNRKEERLKSVKNCATVLVHGREYPVVRSEEYKRIRFADGVLFVPSRMDDEQAERAIGNWYRRTAISELSSLLARLSDDTGLVYKSFSLTNARRAWGNCDGDGNIRLNWRLVMLDVELAEYVAVHELCHTLHHNHSTGFWAEVKKHMPQYAALRKRIKTFSQLTELYR